MPITVVETVHSKNLERGELMDVFKEFERLMADRGAEPRLDLACALISNAGDPAHSVDSVVAGIDAIANSLMADDVPSMMKKLFSPREFFGNSMNYDDPANSLLGNVIESKLGIPISLSVIAMSVAERKGLSMFGVGMPGHYLCATPAADGEPMYFDPFHGSGPLSASDCRSLYEGLTGLANWSDEFLNPATSRLTVVRILANLKSIYRRKGDVDGIRWVMRMRLAIPEIAASETTEFARLVRGSN
jgi:regulator of sirC expression with transglutaminase-like and TPR domain